MKLTALVLLVALATGCSVLPRGYDDAQRRWEREVGTRTDESTTPPAPLPADASVDDLLTYAEQNSPALHAAAQRWRAALHHVPEAVSLPDPRLTLGVFADEIETRVGPTDWRIGIQQTFPWLGELDLAGRIALLGAESARADFVAARFEVRREVTDGAFELAYLRAAVEVTRGHHGLMADWEEIARIRYETGLGSEADVVRAQVELGKLDDRLRSLEDLVRPMTARLNAALGRPAGATVPEPPQEWPVVRSLDEAALRNELESTSPDLAASRSQAAAAALAVELADKAFYPDVSLGLEYTQISSARAPGVSGSGDNALAVTGGVTLPLRRGRLEAGVARAEARLAAAEAALSAARHRLDAELEMALYHVRDAERRVGLFRDTLVPKGRESVESIQVAYETGEADFLDLVDAERVLLEFQLGAVRAQADHAQALAEVERVTGVSLQVEP